MLVNSSPSSPNLSSSTPERVTPTNPVENTDCWTSREQKQWQSEDQRQLLGTEEESSDRHSSDEDDQDLDQYTERIWTINQEQSDYYTKQFRSLQLNNNSLLAGNVARPFFEKSRLAVDELRRIWELADVTKDGALSLQEFQIAMHLVVLRRNNVPLPESVPLTLLNNVNQVPAKEWTKFADSPLNQQEQQQQPVNFDFVKVSLDTNSNIYQPVPLRLTPDSPKPLNTKVIQRPQVKRPTIGGGAGGGAGTTIPPPPFCNKEEPISLPVLETDTGTVPPPPPPRRTFRNHGRSSSLDLSRVLATTTQPPPQVPPRVSPHFNYDVYEVERRKLFAKFELGQGAFEIYRRQPTDDENNGKLIDEKKLEQFQRLQQENTVLLRLCQELSQELSDVKECNLTLKLKLEKST